MKLAIFTMPIHHEARSRRYHDHDSQALLVPVQSRGADGTATIWKRTGEATVHGQGGDNGGRG